ncbi:MAG: STN domain-containing protein [Opitutaceae bacterium]
MPTRCAPLEIVRSSRTVPALLAGLLGCLLAFPPGISAAETNPKKAFDIPAGDAVVSLKQFSAQSGTQVIYPAAAIQGTRTNALKGAFTAAEAIERLLSGTNLRAARDRESGSFAVSRGLVPRKETARPNG